MEKSDEFSTRSNNTVRRHDNWLRWNLGRVPDPIRSRPVLVAGRSSRGRL